MSDNKEILARFSKDIKNSFQAPKNIIDITAKYLSLLANAEADSPYIIKDYIEVTTSGAYINTDTPNTSNAYFEVDFQYTNTPGSNAGIFGCSNAGGLDFEINSYGGASYAIAGTSTKATFTDTAQQRHKIKADNTGIYIDGEKATESVNWATGTNLKYYIFAFNLNGTAYCTGNAKIYSVKIWNGATLVKDFVPAVRKSDNVVGLYDQIGDTFYTNAGTGSFIAG